MLLLVGALLQAVGRLHPHHVHQTLEPQELERRSSSLQGAVDSEGFTAVLANPDARAEMSDRSDPLNLAYYVFTAAHLNDNDSGNGNDRQLNCGASTPNSHNGKPPPAIGLKWVATDDPVNDGGIPMRQEKWLAEQLGNKQLKFDQDPADGLAEDTVIRARGGKNDGQRFKPVVAPHTIPNKGRDDPLNELQLWPGLHHGEHPMTAWKNEYRCAFAFVSYGFKPNLRPVHRITAARLGHAMRAHTDHVAL